MGSLALTAPDSWGFMSGSTLYAGVVNGWADNGLVAPRSSAVTSYYAGATVATPVTGLRMGASFDYLNIAHANNDDYSLAGYLSFQATEKLSFHARAEYLKDKVGNVPGTGSLLFNVPAGSKAEVLALTGTIQYDLWKNVISRLEVRWDHSLLDNGLFGPNNALGQPSLDNAVLVAANIIYKF
jgi:hypothetical protein